ncbi:MAG: TetR/AcrR family transcriptional regulator [Coriobacteriales bacterium]|nr:TetR/AcrR family transcriptional regulator [Coriobacteriales bacterium]MBQ6585659.1 TetR/AcrR family transcriptional regulator [Coriobacteriales bacterium]
MDKNDNKRVKRTKRALRDALTELMEQKGFERVSVCDITDAAHVNRGTFYSHYSDKNDLLRQCEDQLMEDISAIQMKHADALPRMLMDVATKQTPPPVIVDLYSYLQENKRFVRVLLSDNGDPAFVPRMKAVLRSNVVNLVLHYDPNANVDDPIGGYYFAFCTEAQLGILRHWLETGAKETPLEMARIIMEIGMIAPYQLGALLLEKAAGCEEVSA